MRLLAIAVPTFRRAHRLDRQLAWLAAAVAGVGEDCEIILSDNASPDETPAVCAKWAEAFGRRAIPIAVLRNETNIGPLPNIAQCIRRSHSRFTWVIGDDDDIDDGTLAWLVGTLKADAELASVVINYRTAGMHNHARVYDLDADLVADGKTVFETCYRQRGWGLGFMSAQVYRTAFAQAVMEDWPDGFRNYDYQTWVTVRTGLMGKVLLTRNPRVTYVTGDSVYVKNKRAAMSMVADEIEILVRLAKDGLSPALMRDTARRVLWDSKGKFVRLACAVPPALTADCVLRLARYMRALRRPPPNAAAAGGRGAVQH